MWGSRPLAERVTASAGTSASGASPFSSRYASTSCFMPAKDSSTSLVLGSSSTPFRSLSLIGPRLVPLELAASYPEPAADGRGMEVARARRSLTEEPRTDGVLGRGRVAVLVDERSVRPSRETASGRAHRRRADRARSRARRRPRARAARSRVSFNELSHDSHQMQKVVDDEVDGLDADEGHDEPAGAVDEKVARRIRPRRARGISRRAAPGGRGK